MLETLKNIPLTFYSSSFYQNLATKGKGIGIGFIIIVTILNLGKLLPSLIDSLEKINEEQVALLEILPDVEIKNGTLSIQGEQKQDFTIFNETEEGPFHIIFDMKAKTPKDSDLIKKMIDNKTILWINKNAMFMYNVENQTLDRQYMEAQENLKITHDDWKKASSFFSSLSIPFIITGYSLLIFISHIVLTFIGGFFLLALSPLFKRKTNLQATMRLTAAAKIPVAFVFLIIATLPLFQTLLWFGFAIFALLSLPQIDGKKL